MAADFAIKELPLGMMKTGGLGPDEFAEMYGTVVPNKPEGMYDDEYFASLVRNCRKRRDVTIEQWRNTADEAILEVGDEYERKGLADEARRRILQEDQATLSEEIARLSDEDIEQLATDPDFISEEDYLANPQKYVEEQKALTVAKWISAFGDVAEYPGEQRDMNSVGSENSDCWARASRRQESGADAAQVNRSDLSDAKLIEPVNTDPANSSVHQLLSPSAVTSPPSRVCLPLKSRAFYVRIVRNEGLFQRSEIYASKNALTLSAARRLSLARGPPGLKARVCDSPRPRSRHFTAVEAAN